VIGGVVICLDCRRSLISGLMRAVIIVVPGVLSEDLEQMSLIEDQHLIEDVPAERSDQALTDRVRPRGLRPCCDNPYTAGVEDLVDSDGKFCVPIADMNRSESILLPVHGQVPGLLGHPAGDRIGADTQDDVLEDPAAFHTALRDAGPVVRLNRYVARAFWPDGA
jgi:hypothetical protein